MTRNDYFLIARAIKTTFRDDGLENDKAVATILQATKRELLRNLIPLLKANNPSFQTFRFLLSCDAEELHGELK